MAHAVVAPLHGTGSADFPTARRYPRVPVQTPTELSVGNSSTLGEAQNLSLGGLLLRTARILDCGTEVTVRFNLPTGHSISTRCVVVHAQPGNQVGLRFVQLEEHNRRAMAQFIRRMGLYTRRGARITKRLHVTLRATNVLPALPEMAETIALSRHGGLLVTRARLATGEDVHLWWPEAKRGAKARIVHRRISGTAGLLELGFEFIDESNFWQLEFPSQNQ